MNKVTKIWTDLDDLKTDVQVSNYWEANHPQIIKQLKVADTDFDVIIKILYSISKSLNNREKYSSIYYLHQSIYLILEKKLYPSDLHNELKFELGRGLHHNLKYNQSKRLFNELAKDGFDIKRIDDWWDQSAFASTRDRIWLKTDFLPALGHFLIALVFLFIAIKFEIFLFSTIIYIIISELYESWWYQYKFESYLSEFKSSPYILSITEKLKKKIFIELIISLLFYPIYFFNKDLLIPLLLIIVIYFQVFNFGLNYYYLPKLIGELNRKENQNRSF
jgi:hypothetical protein